MAIEEVKLPELSEGIDSGDVLEILVSEGDVISKGQDIVEMETDKATVPVASSHAGKVVEIVVSTGDSVPIGGVLLKVEATADASGNGGSASPAPPKQEAPEKEEAPATQEAPAKQEAPAAKPAEQAPPAAPQPAAQTPPPAAAPAQTPAQPAPATTAPTPPPTGGDQVIAAGPAIRRFAREVGVDLRQVTGTGDGGRITREDILAVVRTAGEAARSGTAMTVTKAAAAPSPTGVSELPPDATDYDDFGPIRVERMTKIRKTIAAQMHTSWSTVPRVTNFDDADVTDLERLRQSSKEDYAAQGIKLTTMPFLIKAVATALRHHPAINAVIDQENEQIIYKSYVNIGIAVDTDRGLVVPVMRDVDRMGVPDVARGLSEMAGKVRGGQFGVNDLRGGSFTISNLGAIGGQYSTPVVNVPEVAILLVGRSRKQPVVMPDDSIQPRLMMPLSLSYDHRLVDGATAGRFLNDVIAYLESPSRLLLAL